MARVQMNTEEPEDGEVPVFENSQICALAGANM